MIAGEKPWSFAPLASKRLSAGGLTSSYFAIIHVLA